MRADVVGCVLAGGRGRRLGGDKAVVSLEGRALADYPLAALRTAGVLDLALVVKRDTAMPAVGPDVAIWVEPDEPRHPLTGLVHALRCAGGRAVLACAADLPLLDGPTLRRIESALRRRDTAVVPRVDGRLQPLCAIYDATARRGLERFAADASLQEAVLTLTPRIIDFEDPTPFFNVNEPADVLQASVLLRQRAGISRT